MITFKSKVTIQRKLTRLLVTLRLMTRVPVKVKREAQVGIDFIDEGFRGGTTTGWNRAFQLANEATVDLDTLRVMRDWFARHYYVSRPGYVRWVEEGRPSPSSIIGRRGRYRGAVSWLIWGGDAGYRWITSRTVQIKLDRFNPNKDWSLIPLE